MNVVEHQTVSPNLSRMLLTPMSHLFNIGLIVAIIEKGLLSPVATLGDVMWELGPTILAIPAMIFVGIKEDHKRSIIKYGVPNYP